MEIKELQNKCLEITLVFKEFCEKHGLLFYLCGGGCIGAIRHHGFIPWDDDLDVFMPRADYEKMCKLWVEDSAGDPASGWMSLFQVETENAAFLGTGVSDLH